MDSHTRRRFLLASGAALAGLGLAGCLEDEEPPADEWEDVRTIGLEGYVEHWLGVEPDFIAGEENPTLELIEGEEYTIEWTNGDGVLHNLQIEDEGGEILYETDDVDVEGEGDSVQFTASPEMTTYVCMYHRGTQIGDIEVL